MPDREGGSSRHWNPIRLGDAPERTAKLRSITTITDTRRACVRVVNQTPAGEADVSVLAQITETGSVRCGVARALYQCGWNRQLVGYSIALASALIIAEKEQFVLDDGTAN